jgi:hypothetical protein
MAGQRILLIRMDYLPSVSPMSSLQARLTSEGYTTISHLTDGLYKNAYWDAVIGRSQGAIDALRDAPELARHNPQVTIVTHRPAADEHLVWMCPRCALPQPAYERIWPGRWITFLSTSPKRRDGWVAHHAAHALRRTGRQDDVVDIEPTHVAALPIESTPLQPIAEDPSLQKSSVIFRPDWDCISIPQGDAICMGKLP